jgi:hypothetical protein
MNSEVVSVSLVMVLSHNRDVGVVGSNCSYSRSIASMLSKLLQKKPIVVSGVGVKKMSAVSPPPKCNVAHAVPGIAS